MTAQAFDQELSPYWQSRYEAALMAENGATNESIKDQNWADTMNRKYHG